MAICTDFVLSAVNYQTVSNDYISALNKPIDDITQPMLERHNLLHDCLQQIIILVVFMRLTRRRAKSRRNVTATRLELGM